MVRGKIMTEPMLLIFSGLTVLVVLFTMYGLSPFLASMYHVKFMKSGFEEIACQLKAVSLDPRSDYLYVAAEYYHRHKQPGIAVRFAERSIADYDGEAQIWHLLNGFGFIKMALGSYREAKDAFEKSLFFHPDQKRNKQAAYGLGLIQQILSKTQTVEVKL
jgi:tetratricopeptide (TPR) repeat protein